MFLHLSVSHSVHRVGAVLSKGCCSWQVSALLSRGRHPLWGGILAKGVLSLAAPPGWQNMTPPDTFRNVNKRNVGLLVMKKRLLLWSESEENTC